MVRQAGIDFEVVEATVIDGGLVSSSLIRQCLSEGRVDEAARLLGRPHRIRGRVDHGAGRGAGLGFPTVNLAEIDTLVPMEGVYAGLAWVDGQIQRGRPRAISVPTRRSVKRRARSKPT